MATNTETGKANFYFVRNFKFCKNVPQATANTKETVSNGKTYYHEEYNTVEGRIEKIYVGEKDVNGKQWKELHVAVRCENGEVDYISMYLTDYAAESFLKRLPNINLTMPVQIKVSKQDWKTETKSGSNNLLNIYELDAEYKAIIEEGKPKLCKFFWNKETPGLLPDLKKVTVNGKDILDRTERLAFFEKLIVAKNTEAANVTIALKGFGKKIEDLVYEVNNELGVKICTGFTGGTTQEIESAKGLPPVAQTENVAPADDDLPF